MRIQVVSDLHLEFHKDDGDSFLSDLAMAADDVDVLVVAGDLTTEPTLFDTLTVLSESFPDVVYVEGNHEYYGSDREQVLATFSLAERALGNLHWLRESTVEIQGQRFVGSTLWFPDTPAARTREYMLGDFRMIRGFREWVYGVNKQAVAFLKATVKSTDVVVTHHVPSTQANAPRWRSSPLNCYFVTELGDLIAEAEPKLWCFGHTHDSRDLHIGETRLVCNPFGYARYEENPAYTEKLIVEV